MSGLTKLDPGFTLLGKLFGGSGGGSKKTGGTAAMRADRRKTSVQSMQSRYAGAATGPVGSDSGANTVLSDKLG